MAEQTVKRGVFYGVGIGPGDPELLTLKAVRVLEACRVIAAPQTHSGETLALDIASRAVDLTGKKILPLYFSMARDRQQQRQAHLEAAQVVREELDRGEDVAMLNLGDVSIYATYSYLMEMLRGEGYETVMIPGVPSFCAVAARLGVSLTEMNSPLHIVPAGGGPLEETLELPGTKVLMKSGRRIPQVLEALEAHGLTEKSALVRDCGLPTEEVCEDLRHPPEGTGYFATIIVKE